MLSAAQHRGSSCCGTAAREIITLSASHNHSRPVSLYAHVLHLRTYNNVVVDTFSHPSAHRSVGLFVSLSLSLSPCLPEFVVETVAVRMCILLNGWRVKIERPCTCACHDGLMSIRVHMLTHSLSLSLSLCFFLSVCDTFIWFRFHLSCSALRI